MESGTDFLPKTIPPLFRNAIVVWISCVRIYFVHIHP